MVDKLEAEDLARARWYSFFSRWLLAPPDQQAIDMFIPSDASMARDTGSRSFRSRTQSQPPMSLATASAIAWPDDDAGADSLLESAWTAFVDAVAGGSLAEMRTAYDDTFISVGEAPVSLHASVYLTGFSNERPLAEVRQWLAGQGIQSRQAGLLTEDHLGLLCEAMAWLIIGQGDESARAQSAAASDASQQFLFQRFIAPVCDEFCARLGQAPDAGVYRELGQLLAAFSVVERQAFDIER